MSRTWRDCHVEFQRRCATMGQMKESPRQTIRRRSGERRLEIGDTVSIKEGVVAVVVARYRPSGTTDQVHYVVELRPEEELIVGAELVDAVRMSKPQGESGAN